MGGSYASCFAFLVSLVVGSAFGVFRMLFVCLEGRKRREGLVWKEARKE